MKRFVKIFAVAALVVSPAFAEEPPVVVAVSKTYVDSGFAQKASAAIVASLSSDFGTLSGNLATNNTIAKANSAVQPGALAAVATSGSYSDLSNKPNLATVATSGSYNDLSNTPANMASQSWVLAQIANAELGEGGGEDGGLLAAALLEHTEDTNNPHEVTKAQVNLGNVQNVDQTNAGNLSSGTVPYARLPVGNSASTIAAGNDSRFALAESALQTVTKSGSGNVVKSVTKNADDIVVTYDTVPTTSELSALSGRIGSLENLGYYLGVSPDKASLPTTVSAAKSMWGITRTPEVGDYVDILEDETNNNANNSYRIVDVTGNVITWSSSPFRTYSSDTSGFMTKQPSATNGRIGTFNSAGQVVDSGKSLSDLATAAQGTRADNAVQYSEISNYTSNPDKDTIATAAPQGQLPNGRAFIWIQ